ncbi:Rab GTPase [Cavenderia fasciculata]|uniref:Rab GTPase n=1 Tax=Cavenderia fasciculata TaxID=261658 RepID=F4PPT3_CACFS|nr:Rab GTPase [Cavenderia fasciculata]EGG22396.1 Rab GTPase [Cavenderia fasciculata]|eukprot:XP_004360247.1 Rab GTPase [Cavenderia fasciculata]
MQPNCYLSRDTRIEDDIKVNRPCGPFTDRITFKATLVGSSGVGKTTLQHRICGTPIDHMTSSTIGAVFYQVPLQVDQKTLNINLWDTGGQEKLNIFNLLPFYFRGSDFIFLVFDLFDRQSFMDLSKWLDNANRAESSRRIPPNTIVVGNKLDLERKKKRLVSLDEAQSFAFKRGFQYIETSALENENCELIKELVIHHIKKTIKKEQDDLIIKENKEKEKEKEKEKGKEQNNK